MANTVEISSDNNIRGDTIGNTAYSQKYVIQILIKLLTVEDLNEDNLYEFIEKDLCVLWDMTVEKDVSDFLLAQNAMKIFCDVLKASYNPRITEVIIGTMTNMCSHKETIQEINKNYSIRNSVYTFISCEDSLVIIQVMRFIFSNIYSSSVNLDSWFQFWLENDFSNKVMYILNNSINTDVISNTFETINCICCSVREDADNNTFKSLFIKTKFIQSLLVGFKELCQRSLDPEKLERSEIVFFSIHSVLTKFEEESPAYIHHLPDLLGIISNIITKYIDTNNLAIVDAVEYLTACLPTLLNRSLQESIDITDNLLKLWKDVAISNNKFISELSSDNNLMEILPQYYVRVFKNVPKENIKRTLLQHLMKNELTLLTNKINEMIKSNQIHISFNDVLSNMNEILDDMT